jgi:hypothetical protein
MDRFNNTTFPYSLLAEAKVNSLNLKKKSFLNIILDGIKNSINAKRKILKENNHMNNSYSPISTNFNRANSLNRLRLPKKVKEILAFKIYFPIVLVLVLGSFVLGLNLANFSPPSDVIKTPVNQNIFADDMNIFVNEAQSTKTIRLANATSKAPQGKSFLVLFTDVENASSSAKNVIYGNYFRLEENGKKFAPLPLNAQFAIPPQATLNKQLVFIVDEGKKTFNILVGDINKSQQNIAISF